MLLHARRASVPEETNKDLACTAYLSRTCEIIGQVAPTQARAGEDATNGVKIDRESQPAQPCRHGLDPLSSTGAERCHAFEKSRVVFTNKMPEDVIFTSVVLARKLNSGDELDTPPSRLGPRHRECGDGVMVGNCQGSQANPCRGDDHFAWGASAVGMRRVYMQVGTITRIS